MLWGENYSSNKTKRNIIFHDIVMTSVQLIISRAALLIIVIILNIKLKRKTK